MMNTSSPLAGLRNGQNTNLSAGTVRNADAVLLLLNSSGGVARGRDLKAALREWRPGRHDSLRYGYLFQSNFPGSGYGFCGTDFHTESYKIHHLPTWDDGGIRDGHESVRRTFYYRSSRGVFAITAEGYRRLAELGIQKHS